MGNASAAAPLTATGREAGVRYAGALAFVAAFASIEYVVHPDGAPVRWWTDLGWTLASFLAGWECLRTARRLTGRQRYAWGLFAAGCFAWFAGMVVWDYRELVQQTVTPFPDLSDIGFLALAPLFVLGLVFKYTERGTSLTLKDTGDLGIIVSVVALGAMLALSEPLSDPALSFAYRAVAIALPILYISALIFALLALLRHAATRGRAVLILIFGSLALHAVVDSLYAYSLLEQTYATGHSIDIFWVIAFALTYSAAVAQRRTGDRGRTSPDSRPTADARVRRADTLVLTGLLLGLGLVAYAQRDTLGASAPYLPPFLVALAVFLGLREWANQRIQMRLIADIRASERELGRILDHLDDTYYRMDPAGGIQRVSGSVERLLGYAPQEMTGRFAGEFYADDAERRRLFQALEANGGTVRNFETELLRKDGSTVWVSVNAHHVRDAAGAVVGVEGTSRDVSERKAAEAEMRKLSSALRQSADAVIITDRDGVIEYVNPAFEEITGYAHDEVVGRRPNILKSGKQDRTYYDGLWRTIRSGEAFSDVLVNKRKDESLYYEAKTITPLMDEEGRVTHFVSTGKDITEQMQVQERMQFLAHHDMLTGLPNRNLFLDRVEQVLARTRWHERMAVILFMDLDQFKYVNDSLGHEVGDKLLVGVAERLRSELRPGDTVARFGGDEFVVLLDDVDSYYSITRVVEKLRERLRTPIAVDGMSFRVTATIGISVYPYDGDHGASLLKNADNAMYRAKEHGRDTYSYYSGEMSARVHKRLTLESRLRDAVEEEGFELYYQPQIDIVDNTVVGVEALLRWQDPPEGGCGPAEFVPLLEDTGLIVPVGEWVLREACAQGQRWAWQLGRDLEVAVNISARQFADSGFPELVRGVARDSGLDPRRLQLEMTESIYLRTTQANSETVRSLSEAGIRLAIDDFGTGYSALNYLKRFPIHVLKIDRSFIQDIPGAADDAALVIAVLAMAEGLGLRVVAEGVETRAQLDFLREHGCRYVQGFLFSKPLPAAELEALLRDTRFP